MARKISGKRRDAQAAATRRAILKTAREFFGDKGYHSTSIEDIAAKIGAARSALYHHFPNKLAVFEAVVAEFDESMGQEILDASTSAENGWGSIKAGCMRFLDACTEPRYRRIMLIDAPVILHPSEPEPRRSVALTAEKIEPLIRSKDKNKSLAIAYAIVGTLEGLAKFIAHAPDSDSARRTANKTLSTVLLNFENSSGRK